MGKKKINAAFKVAGSKSLKLKHKAKPVKTQLKNVSVYEVILIAIQKIFFKINIMNKKKTIQVDSNLIQLQEEVRQSSNGASTKRKPKKLPSKLPSVDQSKVQQIKKTSDATLKDLSEMQL